MSQVKLKCVAGRGMFPHEAGVLIRGLDRCYESMIDRELLEFDQDQQSGESIPALVPVEVVQVNGTKMLVELPRQVMDGGRRIWVPQSEVQTEIHSA